MENKSQDNQSDMKTKDHHGLCQEIPEIERSPPHSLEEARKQLREIRIEGPVYDGMRYLVNKTPELADRILEHYAMLGRGERIRPNFPNEMQILYMRDRQTLSFLLFPELLEIGYQVGRLIGEKFIAPYLSGSTLPEIMASNLHFAADHNYARQEIVTATNDYAVYRNYECADCYGLPNIGLAICCYEAGTAAGSFETPLGRPVRVRETKCCANGSDFCEFEVTVL
jgi:predicted hydrocarbon binding protein